MLVIFEESTQIIFLLLFQFRHCFHIFYITYVHCLWSQKCNTESDRPTSGKTIFLVRKHKTLQHKAKWRKMSQEGLNISFFLRAVMLPAASFICTKAGDWICNWTDIMCLIFTDIYFWRWGIYLNLLSFYPRDPYISFFIETILVFLLSFLCLAFHCNRVCFCVLYFWFLGTHWGKC